MSKKLISITNFYFSVCYLHSTVVKYLWFYTCHVYLSCYWSFQFSYLSVTWTPRQHEMACQCADEPLRNYRTHSIIALRYVTRQVFIYATETGFGSRGFLHSITRILNMLCNFAIASPYTVSLGRYSDNYQVFNNNCIPLHSQKQQNISKAFSIAYYNSLNKVTLLCKLSDWCILLNFF